MTPFMVAVEQGNYDVFRLLLEIYYYMDRLSPSKKLLAKLINVPCDKGGETALIKAIRTNNSDMANSLLFLCPEIYSYEMIITTDGFKKNALHYAVINQNKVLIEKLV